MDHILIENTDAAALVATEINLARFMLDFEIVGKSLRQAARNTRISNHEFSDLTGKKTLLGDCKLVVRMDPNQDLLTQINFFQQADVDEVMIPMIESLQDLKYLTKNLCKYFKILPLIETKFSLLNLNEIISLTGCEYVHFGLNDLHLQYHKKFMFSMFTEGEFLEALENAREANIKFGIGGIAPVSAQLDISTIEVMSLLIQSGASGVILSRAFNSVLENDADNFSYEINKLREVEAQVLSENTLYTSVIRKIEKIENDIA